MDEGIVAHNAAYVDKKFSFAKYGWIWCNCVDLQLKFIKKNEIVCKEVSSRQLYPEQLREV